MYTNFRNADLRHARFIGSILDAVNLQSADLRGADFTDSIMRNDILLGANLCGAKMPNGSAGECKKGETPDDGSDAFAARPAAAPSTTSTKSGPPSDDTGVPSFETHRLGGPSS
jgi:hypothetical protein